MGIHRADSTERRLRRTVYLEPFFTSIPVLAFDDTAARRHARLWSELLADGNLIGSHDLIIAATALAHDFAMLTDKVRDFGQVPGLEVRRPSW